MFKLYLEEIIQTRTCQVGKQKLLSFLPLEATQDSQKEAVLGQRSNPGSISTVSSEVKD